MNVCDILKFAKSLSKYAVGAEGNISAKSDNGFLIKASGTRLDSLDCNDLVYCDYECSQLNNFSKKPSIEVSFHAFLMQMPGINYVGHTHPTNILKVVCSNLIEDFAHWRFFPDQVVYNGKKSCIVPYAMPGNKLTQNIKCNVENFVFDQGVFPSVILLKNHGIICCGATIKQCVIATEICEKSAEIFLSSTLNNLNKLSQIEIDEIDNSEMEKFRKI